MKRGLMGILIAGMLFFSSCEKEDHFIEMDFKNEGKIERLSGGYHKFEGGPGYDFYLEEKLSDSLYVSPDSIYNLPFRPENVSFYGPNKEGELNMFFEKNTLDSSFRYLSKIKDGKFLGAPELLEKRKRVGRE